MNQVFIKFLTLILIGISTQASGPKYPGLWWKKVDPASVPKWEVLPQAASKEKNEVILSKHNGLGNFGNFATTPFIFLEKKYGSMEGFIQSMLYPDGPNDQRLLAKAKWLKKRQDVSIQSGYEAFTSGKEAEKLLEPLKITWVSFEGLKIEHKGKDSNAYFEIIEMAMRIKLDSDPNLKKLLYSTGNLKLRPEHQFDQGMLPAWKYWEIYMKIRKDLLNDPNRKLYSATWFETFKKKNRLSPVSKK